MLRRTEEVARGHRGAAPGGRDRRCARAHDARVRAGAVGAAAGSASASCRVARATAAQRQPGLGCCHRARRTRRLRRGLHLAQPGGGRGSGARHNPPARGNHGARVSGLAPRSAVRASAQASGTVALTPPRSIAVSCSLIAALVCALPSCGHAQSGAPVTGTVTEPDGRPLSGVVVAVQGLGLSVATDATGRYVLSRVPAGQQLLQFRRIGFAAREVTVIVTAGTPATADAVLDPQPIDLGTVVVEGVSRAPERMIDAPAAVDVVGPKLTLGGGELGTARADLRHASVSLNGRLGVRVNLGYTRSDDWTRSRTAKDGSDWKEEYAPTAATPPTSPGPERVALNGQTTDAATGRALGTPDPLVTVYGSARVDYYAANRSIVTFEGGAAQEENPVFTIGSGRNQARRLVRPWARLAWDAGGSGVSAWYSGLSLPEMVRLASGEPVYTSEAAFHLEGRTSQSFAREAGRLVVGASVQDNEVNSNGTILGLAYDDRSDQYYGAFAQLEYRVGLVRVIGAVRWDDANLYAPQLSPKAAFEVRVEIGRAHV